MLKGLSYQRRCTAAYTPPKLRLIAGMIVAARFRPRVARARASHALALRAAAQELSQLPELVEASACYADMDLDAARAPLERAVQIVSGFPAPAYQLIVHGGLAQVLRATGEAEREASLWQDLLAARDVGAAHQLHVLNGVACCALHRGATEEAASACEQAFGVLAAETELRAHWARRFHLHVALGELSSGSAAGAQAAAEAAAREAESEAQGEAGAELARVAMQEAASLLRGDALAAGGDAEGALLAWGALAPPEGAETETEAEEEAEAEGGAALLRRQAALCRVGAAHVAGGEGEGAEASLTAEGVEAAIVSLKAAVALDARLGSKGALHSAVGAQSLSLLGGCLSLCEQPLASEGLHRTATDRLRALLRHAPPGMPSGGGELRRVWEAGLLARSLDSFAELVAAMEWNGQGRTSEAAQLKQEAAQLRAEYAPLLLGHRLGATHPAFAAAAPALAPHAQWGGLEPWYASSLQHDWLAALAG